MPAHSDDDVRHQRRRPPHRRDVGPRHPAHPRRLHPHPGAVPAFDPDWAAHGHLDAAVELPAGWGESPSHRGARVEVVRLAGSQPGLCGRGAGPGDAAGSTTTPSCSTATSTSSRRWPAGATGSARGRRCWPDGRLYGRGGADDGYAAVRRARPPSRRCRPRAGATPAASVLIEASEESGSPDLPAYVEAARRPHRHAEPGRLPRLGLRRLRPPLDDHVAARPGQRPPHRRGLDRGGALRAATAASCRRRSGSSAAARPGGGRADRAHPRPELWTDVPAGRLAEIRAVADELGTAAH